MRESYTLASARAHVTKKFENVGNFKLKKNNFFRGFNCCERRLMNCSIEIDRKYHKRQPFKIGSS